MANPSGSGMDVSQILALARTDAGKKLIAMMSANAEMRQSAEKAAAGDYADAKQSLRKLLTTPEGRALFEELKSK